MGGRKLLQLEEGVRIWEGETVQVDGSGVTDAE